MKSINKKLLTLISCLLLVSMLLSACGLDSSEQNEVSDAARQKYVEELIYADGVELLYTPQVEDYDKVPSGYTPIGSSEGGPSGLKEMYKILGNDKYELYIDFFTTDIAVLDKTSGYAYHSNPKRDPSTTTLSNAQRSVYGSPLSVQAYDASGKSYAFNFYDNCYSEGEGTYYVLKTGENSLRLVYTIGNDPDKDLFPPVITEETWEEKISSQLDALYTSGSLSADDYRKANDMLNACYRPMTPQKIRQDLAALARFEEYYPTINTIPMRITYEGVSTKQKREVKKIMEMVGFTVADVKAEMEKVQYQGPERSVLYTIPVDLTLSEEGLNVEVDTSLILGPTKQRLYTISLYPGFGGINATKNTNGYMIVPDGSGAIIPANITYDSGNYDASGYKARIYGNDLSFSREYDTDTQMQALAGYLIYNRGEPDSGKKNGGGFLAILEQGLAQASVKATPGKGTRPSNLSYELIYSERDYRTYSTSSTPGMTEGSGTLLSSEPVTGKFSVQYLFTQEVLSYSEYAAILRDYYSEKSILPDQMTEEKSLPFYVDILGCVDLNTTFLGIPLKTQTALTSYSQAKQILSDVKDAGVSNIVARYSYWANGGESNTVAKDVDLIDCMGSKAELDSLLKFCNDSGIGFYPSAEFLQVTSTANGFSKSQDAARRMSRSTATVVARHNAIGSLREDLDEKILVSSKVSAEIAATYEASFKETLNGHKNIALGLIGSEIHSNYKTKDGVTRLWAENDHISILKTFSDKGYKTAVETGNLYTWKYASHIYGLPVGSSQILVESQAIPFNQMLLHGYVSYSMEDLNLSGDYETAILLALETGSALSFRWMAEDDSIFDYTSFYDYFSLNYKTTFQTAIDAYKKVSAELNDVVNCLIVKHEQVDAYHVAQLAEGETTFFVPIARDPKTGFPLLDDDDLPIYENPRLSSDGGVFATFYGTIAEDGTETVKKVILVNYNAFDVELPDRTILPARGYMSVTAEEYEKISDDSSVLTYEELPVEEEETEGEEA